MFSDGVNSGDNVSSDWDVWVAVVGCVGSMCMYQLYERPGRQQCSACCVWTCVNATAGWQEAPDTQSGAVSRLADCMIRERIVEERANERWRVSVFAGFVCVSERDKDSV